jgi:hypothetical protein
MIRPSTEDDLYELLAKKLLPHIQEVLIGAGAGQRLRVTALPLPVMERLCQELQGGGRYRACVLSNQANGAPWRASPTKLIELRNMLSEPLLIFIPPDLRTAAEDSLDVATFTELALRSVVEDLRQALLDHLPEQLRGRVERAVKYMQLERMVLNSDETVEYLLTVVKSGGTPEAAGAALYCFGLGSELINFAL